MSDLSFPHLDINNFPTFPKFGQSLLLIQTKKNFNNPNTLSFFQKTIRQSEQDIQAEQNSLELQINQQQKNQFEPTQSSMTPKKKKTGCICKKTKCLKMYCQCFASGKMCTQECVCNNCNNNQSYQQIIQKAKQSIKQKNQSNFVQLKQSKGCNCKKSQCQKKYCQCYNANIACNETCKCQDCANTEAPYSNKSIKQIQYVNEDQDKQ